jgi:hypothetical protein
MDAIELMREVKAAEDVRAATADAARKKLEQYSAVQIRNLRGLLDELDTKYSALAREFDEFKRKVHERALQCKREEDWCTTKFNEAMRDLGLPEYMRSWEACVTVTITVTGADDKHEATNWIHEALDSNNSGVIIGDIDVDNIETGSD